MNAVQEAAARWRLPALAVGVVSFVVWILLGIFFDPSEFFRSWLFGWIFWMGIGLGSAVVVMINYTTAGEWGRPVRRLLEASASTVPLMALLFIPLCFGLKDVYRWADPAKVAGNHLLLHKAIYLNVPFFLVRAAIYLICWCSAVGRLRSGSLRLDVDGDLRVAGRLQRLSAGCLVGYSLTVTFAVVDWVLSLDYDFFSTAYGLLWMIDWALTGLAFAVVMLVLLERHEPLRSAARTRDHYQLGQLLMVMVMLLAYVNFGQFVIIWSGNLPLEIGWYVRRTRDGWEWMGLIVLLGQLFLPFCLLLFGHTKRRPQTLAAIAGVILGLQLLHGFWMIAPSHGPPQLHMGMDVLAPLALGGCWMAWCLGTYCRYPVLPRYDAASHHPDREVEYSHGAA